ncbi:hypothetical protein [Pseudoalteromonas sp. OANN1]|uniref:hypothetical protein n=1 Tax=Pseudoalteromonas sp. OANN1 TaxID=2954497 RepID=UPI002096A659|nr:hypothetical protein [Pseudoalteromonas sp. OANN1]MCO7199079.1 hypothetical protein [Pseudoalteromonas sp. OANN1]
MLLRRANVYTELPLNNICDFVDKNKTQNQHSTVEICKLIFTQETLKISVMKRKVINCAISQIAARGSEVFMMVRIFSLLDRLYLLILFANLKSRIIRRASRTNSYKKWKKIYSFCFNLPNIATEYMATTSFSLSFFIINGLSLKPKTSYVKTQGIALFGLTHRRLIYHE